MIRSDILKNLIPVISNEFVVCNIGLPSQELHMLDDQPTNFYMLGTMGLSSSIGLGLALVQKQTVIAIDGDGSVLTNFGTLPTIANNVADNFILFIVDNGSYGSTGDQPTYAGKKTSLSKVAEACGCDRMSGERSRGRDEIRDCQPQDDHHRVQMRKRQHQGAGDHHGSGGYSRPVHARIIGTQRGLIRWRSIALKTRGGWPVAVCRG